MNPQFENEFERPKRQGDVLVQWRNKVFKLSRENLDRRWHKYKWMNETEANAFMQNCAPNSDFFEYRIVKRLDTQTGISEKGGGSL